MIEPLIISETSIHRKELMDLAMILVAKTAGFRHSLPAAIQTSLATMDKNRIFNLNGFDRNGNFS